MYEEGHDELNLEMLSHISWYSNGCKYHNQMVEGKSKLLCKRIGYANIVEWIAA